MADEHEGGCVCGATRYSVRGDPLRITVCHCTWCQRRTGSAFGVEAVFKPEDVIFTRDARQIYRHHSDVSGRWLDQEFCGKCGTNLGITLEVAPSVRSIAAGTFDEPSWLSADRHRFCYIYLRSAQDWARVPEGAETYDIHFRKD